MEKNNKWQELIGWCENQNVFPEIAFDIMEKYKQNLLYPLPVPVGTTIWRVCKYYVPDPSCMRGWVSQYTIMPMEYEPGLNIDSQEYFIDVNDAAAEAQRKNLGVD